MMKVMMIPVSFTRTSSVPVLSTWFNCQHMFVHWTFCIGQCLIKLTYQVINLSSYHQENLAHLSSMVSLKASTVARSARSQRWNLGASPSASRLATAACHDQCCCKTLWMIPTTHSTSSSLNRRTGLSSDPQLKTDFEVVQMHQDCKNDASLPFPATAVQMNNRIRPTVQFVELNM